MTNSREHAFGATTTAREVLAGVDLSGRRAIVTGAASGIGTETARELSRAGAEVTLAVRNVQAGRDVAAGIATSTGRPAPDVRELDLAEPASVERFLAGWSDDVHILVNNAGVMATPLTRTSEGWELQFATNHVGHFQLALGLHDALARSGNARVVAVSSVGHVNGGILFDDPNMLRLPYDPWVAYSQSKTANILFAVEAARLWQNDGIAVNACNPGRIWSTGLSRHMDAPPAAFDPSGSTGVSEKTVEQGAATSVLLAASPVVAGVTGAYFEDCRVAEPFVEGVRRGVAAHATDADSAVRLWELTAGLLADAGYAVR
ncbi:oxidoreductase [Subtercola boreus]|uniref:Probable oxidoreductase n=1 Tax=Subtercola boreus TaxID=120213 RepID=A0A3E0VHY5_9MICO|nr:SDR family NAD(P)-dependent oxidoreductase [Subtercola boreus]RFA09113.1 oxidoreductase [Subtercola boreus]TQL53878.1 NAD(P)-dependent dehydrogenase (short-subunit alcohol dehydrogenase family) [Subtercola boreus]